jgi:hypothetical protein
LRNLCAELFDALVSHHFPLGKERLFGCGEFRAVVSAWEKMTVAVHGHHDAGMP